MSFYFQPTGAAVNESDPVSQTLGHLWRLIDLWLVVASAVVSWELGNTKKRLASLGGMEVTTLSS